MHVTRQPRETLRRRTICLRGLVPTQLALLRQGIMVEESGSPHEARKQEEARGKMHSAKIQP